MELILYSFNVAAIKDLFYTFIVSNKVRLCYF